MRAGNEQTAGGGDSKLSELGGGPLSNKAPPASLAFVDALPSVLLHADWREAR